MIKRSAAALLLQWLLVLTAAAHEVRPAYFAITQGADQRYHVLWKQPVMGDMAVRLVPQLSTGWLADAPASMEINGSFAIRTWDISAPDDALVGQTLAIDGLSRTITDVLVDIRLHDGRQLQAVLTPQDTQLQLTFGAAGAQPVAAYFRLGLEHIAGGADHLLFVLALMLLARNRWTLFTTITAFTLAHSITLALSVLHIVDVPTQAADAVIGLSILFLGLEIARGTPGAFGRRPALIAFGFGLLHGFAFAEALNALGLPRDALLAALLAFNLGVEAGQLLFVLAMLTLWWLLQRLRRHWPRWSRQLPAYAIGTMGAFWTLHYTAILLGWNL